ncbi:MAG: hypothetical protein KAR13_10245 [Desulfobulbaceae bacterium]|nr:hypothetical protein [Desulfobulbaceae bacterium]
MTSEKIQKIFINKDNTVTLVCPHCGTNKTVNAAKLKDKISNATITVKCACKLIFRVNIEFRKKYRKSTHLEGYYSSLPAGRERNTMIVKNISRTGIGFATLSMHSLKKNDKIRIKFTLDDRKRSEIDKEIIVRMVNNEYISGEFADSDSLGKALGFYLMT